ncbi:Thyroglobulin type-1, partial [Trinorchestia longiramus]
RFLQVLWAALLATAVFAITLEELDVIVKNHEVLLCSMTECVGPYTKEECPVKTRWMDNVFVDGCCGGCVSFQQENDGCTGKIDCRCCLTSGGEEVGSNYGLCEPPSNNLMCSNCTAGSSATLSKNSRKSSFMSEDDSTSDKNILYSSWCDYGMYCNSEICVREYDWITCINTQEAYDRDIGDGSYVSYRDDYRYRPDCDAEEIYFTPKQCKSSTFDSTRVCVCVDAQGVTIEGKAFSFQGALYDDMNCLCSRRRHELQQSGDVTTTLHCQTNGNYEELQCEDGWCYCVYPNNGTVYGYQMPEPAINLLPCFNRTLIGDQYLRQCESREHAHNVFIKTMTQKGILVVPSAPVTCTIDGSYAARHCEGSSCSCFSKYNADCIRDGVGGC